MVEGSESHTRTSHPYEILDAWWGQHFDLRLGERLRLPFEQALDLYEHCTNYSVTALKLSKPSPHQIQPVLSPWPTEAQDIIFASAQARQMIDLLTGPSGSGYAYSRYAGAFVFDMQGSMRPIGDYKMWPKVASSAMFEQKMKEINALALYSDRVNLYIDSLLPMPPEIDMQTARDSWAADVVQRLRILACLRPLYGAGGVEIGAGGVEPRNEQRMSATAINTMTLESGESEQFLDHIELILEGNAPSEGLLRDLVGRALAIPIAESRLNGAAIDGGQLFIDRPATKRIVKDSLAVASGRPVDTLMQQWLSISLPVPDGNLSSILWATQLLRADSSQFDEWRVAVTEALQYAASLTAGTEHADITEPFAQKLGPMVKKLRTETSRTHAFRGGLKESFITLGLGGVGVAGVAAVGGGVADAAAGAAATALGAAALAFIRSRQKPTNPNPSLEVFLSLGLDARRN